MLTPADIANGNAIFISLLLWACAIVGIPAALVCLWQWATGKQ